MSNLFKNVYQDRKIFITGHTGFKGSWLSTWLLELGADITGYSLEPPSQPSMFEILSLSDRVKNIKGDIKNQEKLSAVLNENQPDMVFHLAAQPLVRRSYKEPVLTYETNLMGTVNLLEAVRKCESVEVLVNVTSDKCYENREKPAGYRESDCLGGNDPYSSSKACSEIITRAYRKSYFDKDGTDDNKVEIASVRAGNVIGGGDWALDRLVPDCIRALSEDKVITIRNPEAVRPWQHVLEPLSGYLQLASLMWRNPDKYSGAWNFGPENQVNEDVEAVINGIIEIWGNGSYQIQKDEVSETSYLQLNSKKSMKKLGWKPIYKLNEALVETVKWYRQYHKNKGDMYQYTTEQIQNYVKNAIQKVDWARW